MQADLRLPSKGRETYYQIERITMNKNRRKPSSSEAANASELRRREWIQSTLGLAVVTAFPGVSIGESVQSDLVRTENEKPGTRDWLLKNTRVDPNTNVSVHECQC